MAYFDYIILISDMKQIIKLLMAVLFVGGLILMTGCSRKVYPSGTETTVSNQWCFPLPGAKVISPYGQRGGRQHTGVDLKTKAKDKIYAAFDGEVVFSGKFSGYGNLVRIKHANGLETYYAHNSKNMVKVGQHVKAGQVIALVGQTGRATTPHLHFETRLNGKPQNPANYFDLTNHTLRKR